MVEKGSLRAQRFLTAINLHHPEHLENVSRELWNRIWSRVSCNTTLKMQYCYNMASNLLLTFAE